MGAWPLPLMAAYARVLFACQKGSWMQEDSPESSSRRSWESFPLRRAAERARRPVMLDDDDGTFIVNG